MRTVHPIQTPTASTQPPMAMASVAPGDSSQEQDQLDDSPVTPHVALPPTSLTSLASIVVPKASLQRTYSSQTRSEQVHGANGVGSHRSQQAHSRDSGPSDSSDTLTSMHTVLESSRHLLGPNAKQRPDGQTTAGWTMNENAHGAPSHHDANNGPSSSSQTASSKRKLDDAPADDSQNKIRRVVRDHAHPPDAARTTMPMTTIVCLHAAVAQKSYGSEKRFLCPPPVVHVEGPIWQMRNQHLSMAVVQETGERSFEQKSNLDATMTASFKFLHVTGTAKAKSFQLTLDIAEPATALVHENAESPTGRTWASFDSAPVTIISKPSKKTAKTRNISSCILAGGPVSLFNRINSQTVRTKYMTIDRGQLCASSTTWSSFNVNVVPRANDPPQHPGHGPQPVTYGSEIVLADTISGIGTSPLIIRKVDKGRVSNEDGGPVSQMQKVALQRLNPDGTRHYLSAAGPMPGGSGLATASTTTPAGQAGTHQLLFQAPRLKEEMKDGVRVYADEVDDYLCWTIVGISKFQYTFFDAFGRNSTIPALPITPFPTLFTAPSLRGNTTMELTVSNFFYEDPKTRTQMPLDVYLGSLGPLAHRVYQAHSPELPVNAGIDGVRGYVQAGPMHTIVVVDLPPLEDIIKALEAEAGADGHSPSSDVASQRNGGPSPSLSGRSLPLLFIRGADGVGYHSGRTVACENLFQSHGLDLASAPGSGGSSIDTNWLAAAQAAAAQTDGGIHGWSLRVI